MCEMMGSGGRERERERGRERGGGEGEFRGASRIVPPVDVSLFISFKDPPLLPLLHHIYFPWISNLDRYLSM